MWRMIDRFIQSSYRDGHDEVGLIHHPLVMRIKQAMIAVIPLYYSLNIIIPLMHQIPAAINLSLMPL